MAWLGAGSISGPDHVVIFFFFSSRRRHTRCSRDWSSDVCSSDLCSTVGPIDQQQLFYLRSRGLSQETARGLLTYGFGTEILGRVPVVEVRSQLDYLVRAWLAGGGAERRLAA